MPQCAWVRVCAGPPDGTEPDLSSGRRTGWYTSLPRAFHGFDDGVLEEADGRSIETLSQERDTLIMGLLELLSHRDKTKPVAPRGQAADES